MKLEWSVTDVTVSGSPDRVEPTILGVILVIGIFLPFQVVFEAREPLWDVGTHSRAQIRFLWVV